MRRIVAVLGLASLVAGSSLALVPTTIRVPAKGQSGTFLIPPHDGYGIAECLASGNDCGRVVAEGYCQAHGFSRAIAFGPVAKEDITGSTCQGGDSSGTVLSITCLN